MPHVKTDYIKRIQSNIGRKVKVSRNEIKEYMEAQNMNIDRPTEADMEEVKAHFLQGMETVESAITEVGINPVSLSEEVSNISPVSFSETDPLDSVETALAFNPEVKDMVGMKAQSMGLQLAESQIEVIASGIDTSGQSFMQTINDIEAALIAYIDYQHSREANEVDSMLERVTDRVYAKNAAVNQQLSQGIHTFRETLTDLDAQQKKIASSILIRLQLES